MPSSSYAVPIKRPNNVQPLLPRANESITFQELNNHRTKQMHNCGGVRAMHAIQPNMEATPRLGLTTQDGQMAREGRQSRDALRASTSHQAPQL